ncbi:hypothetical protein VULLAG_LOCUS23678 [Vulpes lagopus]
MDAPSTLQTQPGSSAS